MEGVEINLGDTTVDNTFDEEASIDKKTKTTKSTKEEGENEGDLNLGQFNFS